MRILVVEDEVDMNDIIVRKLTKEGYAVDTCFDGEEALYYMKLADYDVVILDVMIPKKEGFSVVEEMRSNKLLTPVIFLTAKDSIEDRVKGLDKGANDYLVKPFAFTELIARIRVLTRASANTVSSILKLKDLTMDTSSRIVKRGEDIIELSSKEFAILEYMLCNVGVVLTRDKIENHIWNYDYEGGTNLVNVYIRYLRKKIDSDYDKKLIHTIRGTGYVLKDMEEQ